MSPETVLNSMGDTATEAGISPDKSLSDFAALRKKIFGSKTPKSPKRKTSESGTSATEITDADLAQLFAGENWEEIAGLYFNARFGVTGWDGFNLTDGQKKTLGLSLASSMKMLLKIDPGYIALLIFTINFGGIIAQKEMMYHNLKKEGTRGT
jgi:hypothetical protein